MNPLTNVKNITKLNEIELSKGTVDKKSWHDMYKESAWVFIGGLPYGLTEGDVLAVFSQYGEVVNINLVRDKKTGKTKGFCFLCYANQKSTVLAVDNFNGIKLLNRTLRVDHVLNYKPPKDNEHDDEITKHLKSEGCAPKPINQETSPIHITSASKKKKSKKEKKKHKKDKKEAGEKSHHSKSKIKKEKHDPGYDKYELPQNSAHQSSKPKKSTTVKEESSTSEESSDENFTNSNKQNEERLHDRSMDKAHKRVLQNDFNKYDKSNNKHSSHRKWDLSDSDSDHARQKKSKTGYSEDRHKIVSDGHRNKRKSKSRHSSGSSVGSSPSNNERRRRNSGSEQRNASHSSLSKDAHLYDRRKKVTEYRHDSSSDEDNDDHRGRDSMKHSRSDNSQFKDRKHSHERSSHRYNDDYRKTDNNYNQSDRKDRRSGDQYSRMNIDESRHSTKHSDQKDYRSYDKQELRNSYRESSRHSKSSQNPRSSSNEREEKRSKHDDRDDSRKDWYERRKK